MLASHVPDINDHCRHYCVEPTVIKARQKHHTLLAASIHSTELKRSAVRALTSMYTMDNAGRHMDPGAEGGEVCAELVDNMINTEAPEAVPVRGALIALLEMGPSERSQGWFPKQFDYGMYLLWEPLKKVRRFQAHVVRLAMETGMWAARCRMIHPGGTESVSSRRAAADEYVATLIRAGRKDLPTTKR